MNKNSVGIRRHCGSASDTFQTPSAEAPDTDDLDTRSLGLPDSVLLRGDIDQFADGLVVRCGDHSLSRIITSECYVRPFAWPILRESPTLILNAMMFGFLWLGVNG